MEEMDAMQTRLVPGVGRLPYPAYRGNEPFVFISYAHDDKDLVFPEIKRFNEAGFHVWYDEGIAPGNEWTDEIADALDRCSLFVVMITPTSAPRPNVLNEINFALDENKPFLAIHLKETALKGGLKLRTGSKQAILKYNMSDEEYEFKYIEAFTRLGLERNGEGGATAAYQVQSGAKAEHAADPEEMEKRRKYLKRVIKPRADNLYKEAFEKRDAALFAKAEECYTMLAEAFPEEESHAVNIRQCRGGIAFVPYKLGLAGDREAMERSLELYDKLAEEYPDADYYKTVNFISRILREWDTEKGRAERAKYADPQPSGNAEEIYDDSPEDAKKRANGDLVRVDGFDIEHGLLRGYYGSEKEIKVPAAARIIGPRAFDRCRLFIESVDLNQAGKMIAGLFGIFSNCPNLKTVRIPATVKEVTPDMFHNCPNLTVYVRRSQVSSDFEERFTGKDIVYLDE